MTPPVIAIVAPSGSGKTGVAAALIRMLVDRGYRIAAVKHAVHCHQVDLAGTDSDRLFQAGADRVIVSSSPSPENLIAVAGDCGGVEECLATPFKS